MKMPCAHSGKCAFAFIVAVGLTFIGFVMTMYGYIHKPFWTESSEGWCHFCKEDNDAARRNTANCRVAGPIFIGIGIFSFIYAIKVKRGLPQSNTNQFATYTITGGGNIKPGTGVTVPPGGNYPPAVGSTYPPAASGTYPQPASGTYPPPVGGTYPPPVGGTYPPPVGGTYPPPVGGTYPPPVGGTYPPPPAESSYPSQAGNYPPPTTSSTFIQTPGSYPTPQAYPAPPPYSPSAPLQGSNMPPPPSYDAAASLSKPP